MRIYMIGSNRKFLYWLVVFFTLLMSVTILLIYGQLFLAKLIGVSIVIVLIVALRIWTYSSKKKNQQLKLVSINLNHKYWLKENCNFYKHLNISDKIVFENRIGLLLSKVGLVDNDNAISFETYLMVMSYCTICFWDVPFWDLGSINCFKNNSSITILNETSIECSFDSIRSAIKNPGFSPIDRSLVNELDSIQKVLLKEFEKEI